MLLLSVPVFGPIIWGGRGGGAGRRGRALEMTEQSLGWSEHSSSQMLQTAGRLRTTSFTQEPTEEHRGMMGSPSAVRLQSELGPALVPS